MKRRLLCILFLCAVAIVYRSNIIKSFDLKNIPTARVKAEMIQGELRIIDSKTNIKRGGMGFITIQGRSGVKYTINTSFKKGDRTFNVSQWRIADTNGQTTFNWVVSPETVPGTYTAVISGDGQRISINHTVIP